MTRRAPAVGPDRRAFAMLLVLLVVLLLSAAGMMVAAQMQSRLSGAIDEARDVHLRNLVDSGISLGLSRIFESRYFTGSFEQSLDGGKVTCEIAIAPDSRRTLRVRGEYGGERREYVVDVFVPPTGPAFVRDLRLVVSGSES